MRAITESQLNIPVLGCVAAGVEDFRNDLGEDAEGIVGPSQWEDQVRIRPELGPTPHEFIRSMRAAFPNAACDYPAAQAYAAGVLTKSAIETAGSLEQRNYPRRVFRSADQHVFRRLLRSTA